MAAIDEPTRLQRYFNDITHPDDRPTDLHVQYVH